jgi:hypothetical protein
MFMSSAEFKLQKSSPQWRRQLYTKQGLGPAIYGQALPWALPENSTVRRKDYKSHALRELASKWPLHAMQ